MYTGKLVRLAAMQRDYLPLFVEWVNDYEIAGFINPGLITPISLDDENDWFDEMRKSKESKIFAILTLDEDKVIGNCSLGRISWKNRSATFGILIGDRQYWDKGYGTDATQALMRYAFDEMGLNRVELWVFAYNTRAIRCYEKVGFKLEGTRRQSTFRDGRWWDEHMMALLRDDWLALA
jgi:RimJ/RimL family protein N-acetyltransferase